jgi:transcriptional regulator with XRE-family HTH domain
MIELYLETLGARIKQHRQKQGISVIELGEKIGVDRAQMYKIEKGLNITYITILKLSAALQVPVEDLARTEVPASINATAKHIQQKKKLRKKK